MLLVVSFPIQHAENLSNNSICYGFIVPLPQGKDTTNETFEDSQLRNMINDLLRDNVSVFWSKKDFSALSQSLNLDGFIEEKNYKKGAFIIPFSGDEYKDALITSIIYDYNQTHELDPTSFIKTKIYVYHEALDVEVDKLVEPKIVQHLGKATRYSWPTYLQVTDACGFLTFEYLLDEETSEFLKNEYYNLFIWPYLPDSATYYEQYQTFTDTEGVNAIRNFVNNGGGYIGTCYGAYAASSGIRALSNLRYLRLAYNPNLNRILPGLCLSLTDSVMKLNVDALANSHISVHQVEQPDHPVFYGVNQTFTDFLKSPLFDYIGKNTQVLASFKDLKKRDSSEEVNSHTKNDVVGRPSWVTSTFGEGKLVLYSSHPDFVNNISPLFKGREWYGDPFYGRRIISNSIFYVTSQENADLGNFVGRNTSFIESAYLKTENLIFEESSNHNFDYLVYKIKRISENLSYLKDKAMHLQELFLPLENKSMLFANGKKILRYVYWYCDIYQDYFNRTIHNIENLEKIILMLNTFDETINDKVIVLQNNLSECLNNSEGLISEVLNISEELREIFNSPKISILDKIRLINKRRILVEKFEICLKYIPQICFETLKLLRYSWYNYEANHAILS